MQLVILVVIFVYCSRKIALFLLFISYTYICVYCPCFQWMGCVFPCWWIQICLFCFVSFMWNSVITFCCILTFMMNMYLDYYIYEGSRGIWLLVIALLHCSRYRFCVIFVICLLNLHVVVSNINFYLKFMIVISGKSRFVVVPVLLSYKHLPIVTNSWYSQKIH